MSDISPRAHKREVAARAEELVERVIDQVAVRRMKASHELKEKEWHRAVKEVWEDKRKIQREARLHRNSIETVQPQLVQRLKWLEARPKAGDLVVLPICPASEVVAPGSSWSACRNLWRYCACCAEPYCCRL